MQTSKVNIRLSKFNYILDNSLLSIFPTAGLTK